VLAGHSQGAAKVVIYAAERADPRVAGLVLASPSLRGHWPPELAAEAERLVTAGSPDTLLQPLPDAPWYQLSAANLVSRERMLARTYTAQGGAPLVSRVACPILAFFGTGGDVGGEEDLALIRAGARLAPRVDTALIPGADHVYSGVEDGVGAQIAAWAREALGQGAKPPVLP
jgi:pimeloyl-ACP methyl ester carboxylesterase